MIPAVAAASPNASSSPFQVWCSNAAPPIAPSPTLYALQIVTPTTSASAYVRQGNSVVPAVSATAVRPPGTNRATAISVRPRPSSAFSAQSSVRLPRSPRRNRSATRVPSLRPIQ